MRGRWVATLERCLALVLRSLGEGGCEAAGVATLEHTVPIDLG